MLPARASMNLDELNYDLPPERIAQRPLAERDASRMLLLDRATGAWEDRHFREFPDLLRGDELIVLNNARVLPARLFGRRAGIHAESARNPSPARHEFLQAPIEVLLVRQLATRHLGNARPSGAERFQWASGSFSARASSKPSSKAAANLACACCASLPRTRFSRSARAASATFRCRPTSSARTSRSIASAIRPSTPGREARWPRLPRDCTSRPKFWNAARARNRNRRDHPRRRPRNVRAGAHRTARRSQDPRWSRTKFPKPPRKRWRARSERNRPVLAIGTTVVRALEDAAEKAVARRKAHCARENPKPASFLYPGKPFRVVDQLLTNFHLPQSSLLALVAALRRARKYSSRVSPRGRCRVSLLQLRRLYADPLRSSSPPTSDAPRFARASSCNPRRVRL